jgi:GDSL-like Lipase/Acylhydrolase family
MAMPDVTSRPPAVDAGEAPPRRRRVRAVAIRVLVVTIAVVATLGAVEVAFRILGYRPLYDVYAKPDNFYVADDMVGWRYGPGTTGEFVGPRPFPITFRSDVRINSLGLRGPELTQVGPGGLRVLVLGDSMVSGLEVAENETYSAVAAHLLSERLGVPVQFINAGVRGYGTDQAWLLYRERLSALHADVVLYHTDANDPDDNVTLHRMRRVFGKPAFVLGPDDTLHLVGQPVPNYSRCSDYRVVDGVARRIDGLRSRIMCQLQMNLANHSAFFSYVAERLQRNPTLVNALLNLGTPIDDGRRNPPVPPPAPPPPPPPANEAGAAAPAAPSALAPAPPAVAPPPAFTPAGYAHHLTSVLISRMADDLRRDGARFVLVGQSGDLDALDVAAFGREGIPLVRIDPAFGPDTVIANDNHPNALGHHKIGELVAAQVEPLLREVIASR